MNITQGKIVSAQKVLLYGPEGIGKSTFASQFPDPLFIDTEGSTKHLDVKRMDTPQTWNELIEEVRWVAYRPKDEHVCKTLVIDTIDWSEALAAAAVISDVKSLNPKTSIKGIEDFGYGKGYTYLAEKIRDLLAALETCILAHVNVLLVAHAQMRKFEQPDEMGAYDRWELKLQKKTAPLIKEWADAILFVNYKTFVVRDEKTGSAKGQGSARTLYTSHSATYDAKNRHGLAEELPFEFDSIARIFPDAPTPTEELRMEVQAPATSDDQRNELYGLAASSGVSESEIQDAVALTGVYSADVPIADYQPQFVQTRLIRGWSGVVKVIEEMRKEKVNG